MVSHAEDGHVVGTVGLRRSDRTMLILEKRRVEREGGWQSAGVWTVCLQNLSSQ